MARGQGSRIGVLPADFVGAGRQDCQKTALNPHLNKPWGIGPIHAQFIAHRERRWWLYALPYDRQYPGVCFDDRPCFLIGDEIAPLPLRSGHVRKEHYAYEKNGAGALLAAIEPLPGKRLAQVHAQRTKKEDTRFCQAIAAAWPTAKKIRWGQDNLNTPTPRAFYAHWPAAEAFALAERFEFYYTPKAARWLKMIEIEFSALARECFHRRIPPLEQLTTEVLALVNERPQQQIKIHWQFSLDSARNKLNRHYEGVFAANPQYKKT
jgi:hypothetical protein